MLSDGFTRRHGNPSDTPAKRQQREPRGSGGAGHDGVAEFFEGVAGGAGGKGLQEGRAASARRRTSSRASSMQRCRRSKARASARASSSCRSESSSWSSRASAGIGRAPARAASAGSGRPRAGRCPGSCRSSSLAMSMMSSLSWKTMPICLAEGCQRARCSACGGAGDHASRTAPRSRSASRSCRRPPAGSGRAGRAPRAARRVSAIWPWTSRANVRACSRTYSGPRSATMSEARANRKSPTRIATVLPQRSLALVEPRRSCGLVHHVVVVQAGHVGQLDDHGCLGRPPRRRIAVRAGTPAPPAAAGTACRRPR